MKTIITPMPPIGSYAELKARIAYLDSIKEEQEEVLKENIREVYESLQPAELIKKAIYNIGHDEELVHDAGHLGASMGLNFAIGKLFGQDKSIGGFLKTVVAKQVVSFIYKKYEPQVGDFLGQLKENIVDFFKSPMSKDKTAPPSENPEEPS